VAGFGRRGATLAERAAVMTGATLAGYHAGSEDFWNLAIVRGEEIARQLACWHPDVVGLCELRVTAPKRCDRRGARRARARASSAALDREGFVTTPR